VAAVLVTLLATARPAQAQAQAQGNPVATYPDRPALLLPPRPDTDAPPIVGFPVYPDRPAYRAPSPPGPDVEPRDPPARRELFRYTTHSGGVFSMFPPTLLWEPPLAIKREPRLAFLGSTLTNEFNRETMDFSIGNTVGLFRYDFADSPLRLELDIFGVIITRISQRDFLVDSDYRGGLPVTFSYGPWHGKIGYEHTSTHLGDETLVRTGRQPFDFIKDELVIGVGRWLFGYSLRLYGDAGWALSQFVPGNPSPLRFDLGAEWYHRRVTGFRGEPFAATNLEFNGSYGFNPNFTLQAGWLWRDPNRRLSQLRVYGEYFTGRSPFGQFFQDREHWVGIGIATDY
jgi:hypothetical protein